MENKRILIVEDEVQVALMLCRALDNSLHEGNQIDICPRAEVALRKLQSKQYDLIVTDLYLSGTSGLELIRRVRQLYPRTGTLLITGFGTPEIQEVTEQLGAYYLAKPFGLGEFIATVERILEDGVEEVPGQAQPYRTSKQIVVHR